MASGSIFLKSRTTGAKGDFYVDWTSTHVSGSTYSVNLIFHIKNITAWGHELFNVYINGMNAWATYPDIGLNSSYLKFCEYSLTLESGYYGTPTTSVEVSIPEIGYTGNISGQIQLKAANPEYTLTIKKGTGTSVTVQRTSSPLRGAATGTLSSGATIYVNDVLKITTGTVTGYTTTTVSVSGATLSNGSCTVNSNITVNASASVLSYSLIVSAGSNASVSVTRISSPLKGASTGTLSNGATIYYSDVLQITFSASTGYYLATHKVNNSTFTSGNTHTVKGNVSVAATAVAKSSLFTVDIGSGELGEQHTFEITGTDSTLTHTITYSCGNASGTICTKTSSTTVKWTPPVSLAAESPYASTVTITYKLTTYDGSVDVGTVTETVKVNVPDSVVPTVSIAVTDTLEHCAKYGAYVQGKSTLKIKLTAQGAYGSTISSYLVTFDDKRYSSAEIYTDVIKGSGDLTINAQVKDSRGKTGSASLNVSVLAYNPPTVSNVTVQRCNADGTRNVSGDYLAVVFDAAITPLNDKNSGEYRIKYKKNTAAGYTDTVLSALAGNYSVTGYKYVFAADRDSSYNIIISVKDDFPAVEKSAFGPSQATLWSKLKNGAGFAIGKVAERIGYLDMGFHIYMNSKRLHGLPAPKDSDEAATKEYTDSLLPKAYPVGSVFMSTSSTAPASLFGGTWERVTDSFQIATGCSVYVWKRTS